MSLPKTTARKPSEVFREVYKTGLWSSQPWNSGSGSDPEQIGRPYIQAISAIINFHRFESVVDLGCGDGRILAGLAFHCPGVRFYGVDCCPELVLGLQQRLPHHSWLLNEMETRQDIWSLPRFNRCLYLMKDVLHHWETERILFVLDQLAGQWGFVPGNSRLIITNDCQQKSPADDCVMGGYRALSHDKHPLAMYRPRMILEYLHKSILEISCLG